MSDNVLPSDTVAPIAMIPTVVPATEQPQPPTALLTIPINISAVKALSGALIDFTFSNFTMDRSTGLNTICGMGTSAVLLLHRSCVVALDPNRTNPCRATGSSLVLRCADLLLDTDTDVMLTMKVFDGNGTTVVRFIRLHVIVDDSHGSPVVPRVVVVTAARTLETGCLAHPSTTLHSEGRTFVLTR